MRESPQTSRALNAFSLALYHELRSREGNLFLSPFSIATCLAMVHAGARGTTQAAMGRVLGLSPEAHASLGRLLRELNAVGEGEGPDLSVANALWVQKGYALFSEYVDLLQRAYGAGRREADFAAAEAACEEVNAWVREATRGMIRSILNPDALPALTRLLLANAIYFKGTWTSPFDPSRTRDQPFRLRAGVSGLSRTVPLMTQTSTYRYGKEKHFETLALPYAESSLSLVVFLPLEVEGLAAFEAGLTLESLQGCLDGLVDRDVDLALPRFRVEWDALLGGVLGRMGMQEAFTLGEADLSGMSDQEDLAIGEVVHKACVDVAEEGTEAAAATVVIAVGAAAETRNVQFRADHPFFFLIRDEASGLVLFLGRLVDPTA